MFSRDLIRAAQQVDGLLPIILFTNIEADPAGLRQHVMRFCGSCRNNFVAHFLGKWNVHQMFAVNVTELACAKPIFYAATPALAVPGKRCGAVLTPSQVSRV